MQKVIASTFGGTQSCWNQLIEVMIRVGMQYQIKAIGRPVKLTIKTAACWHLNYFIDFLYKRIYNHHSALGFYRGVTPIASLGV